MELARSVGAGQASRSSLSIAASVDAHRGHRGRRSHGRLSGSRRETRVGENKDQTRGVEVRIRHGGCLAHEVEMENPLSAY